MIQVNGGEFANLLSAVCMDSPPVPVKILFENEGISVSGLNVAKTMQAILTRWPVSGLKVKEPCVLLADPKELGDIVRAKSRGELIRISTKASQPISISTKNNGGAEVMPAEEEDCLIIPDRWLMPKNEKGQILFPMFDNEPATHTAKISCEQLRKAVHEQLTAKAPYVVITFDKKGEARSGHWSGKQVRSWTPLEIEIEGEPFKVAFTESLKTVLSVFGTTTTQVRVSKHEKGQFAVLESIDGNNTTVVATEAIREV